MTKKDSTVLVTGASGFIGMHCILQLLEQGYQVKSTLRSMAKEQYLRVLFQKHTLYSQHIEFVEANLLRDDGWEEAAQGCDYVLHIASPLPSGPPKHEDDLIIPAREGSLRVLKAAHRAGVKRVVLTSSIAAMIAGHDRQSKIFNEADWSNVNGSVDAYAKSKTLAEKAAWTFVNQPDVNLELAAINPSLVLGPILDARQTSTSAELVLTLMQRKYPGVPRLNYSVVDVRDVAAAHLAAMTHPDAAGKRFVCSTDSIWMMEVARILDTHFASRGYKIPTRQLPDFVIKLGALFDPTSRLVVHGLGVETKVSNKQIKSVLDWRSHSVEEAIVSMAESLIALDAI